MMKEMVIDYDSVTKSPLLYSVDYTGGVGTLVPAEIKDAPALASSADIVNVRSLLGLYQLVDKTGFIYPTRHMTFSLPEGGDKCTNVYGVTGALRDLYIRRCIGVEMGQHAPGREEYNDVCIYIGNLIPRMSIHDEGDLWESITVALTAVLPDSILVTGILVLGAESHITISTQAEEDRILRLYMDCNKGHKVPIIRSDLSTLAEGSIRNCVEANLIPLLEREDYTNDKAKELIRRYYTNGADADE